MDFTKLQGLWQLDEAPPNRISEPGGPEEALARTRRMIRRVWWRDASEFASATVSAVVFLLVGMVMPTTWPFLAAAAIVGSVGLFFVVDRIRWRRRERLDASICEALEQAIAAVDHQIALLSSVQWWYLLPIAVALGLAAGGVYWDLRQGLPAEAWTRIGPWLTQTFAVSALVGLGILVGIGYLNHRTARGHLRPQREQLSTLLKELTDPASAEG